MTELQVQSATQSLKTRTPRLVWLTQRDTERRLWIAQHRQIGNLTLTGMERGRRDWFILWQCSCGEVGKSRWSDLKERVDNPTASCRKCTSRAVMQAKNNDPQWLEFLRQNAEKATQIANRNTKHRIEQIIAPDGTSITVKDWTRLRRQCQHAKLRCTNPTAVGYENYGGRGIKFMFTSATAMAEWIVRNLGERPSHLHSIDRIDNDGHYAPNNIRWATRVEQNNNKRTYKVGDIGERIRRLTATTSYGYESIRTFIKQGMTDEEIIKRKRKRAGRPRTSLRLAQCGE